MDNRKYILMSFLAASVLLGMSVRGLGGPLLARLEVGDPLIFGILNATTLAGILVGSGLFFFLNRHPLVYNFTDEVVGELRKVSWPDREDTLRSSLIVVGCTLIIAGSLGFYDFVWGRLTNLFLFTEG